MPIYKTFMKLISILNIILITTLTSCGGSSSSSNNNVDITGRWSGQVKLDQERSCTPPADQFVNLSNQNYTFDVSSLDTENRLVVIDQQGNMYEQFFPDGIQNGEFSVVSLNQDFTARLPTGPTSIYFSPNDGTSADVEVNVTYNRFCTVIFVGDFQKLNAGQ